MAHDFRSNHIKDPILERDGTNFFLLQLRGFKNQYKSTKNKKGLPELVFRSMLYLASTKWYHSVINFLFLALLFMMLSCKYLATRHTKEVKRKEILI